MKPYKIDIAVLLLFFARPDHFEKVFDEVKKASPSRLYLYQDGPREGRPDDLAKIKACREIVEQIDWECEIHTNYQVKNIGCDPSEYLSQKWMFETEEMGIILEDDDVPSQSFFPFCKELLEKYKDDKRIYCISGMNHLDEYKSEMADYIFTSNQSIWGWATWKRCIDLWDVNMPFLEDKYALEILGNNLTGFKDTVNTCTWHRASGIEWYESISWAAQNLNNMLNIVPTRNLISNIGIGEDGTHGAGSVIELPKSVRSIFNKKTFELSLPLRHPDFVLNDTIFLEKLNRITGNGYPIISFFRKAENAMRRFYFADKKSKIEKILRIPKTILVIFQKRFAN
ncbi:MAG: hemolysin activation protein [Bacteroidota bacterium]|nr:hemolysin activation protein [Bacteroidota bacterium]